jgi:hypothetical protein
MKCFESLAKSKFVLNKGPFNLFWLNILPMGIIHVELHVVVANNYGVRK